MSKPFDMALFLAGVLSGSNATRQRHIRQANTIQTAISERWNKVSPWTWQRKHLLWFLNHRISDRADSTRYYYMLTALLISTRLKVSWFPDGLHPPKNIQFQRKKVRCRNN